jgi:hypothetical protein
VKGGKGNDKRKIYEYERKDLSIVNITVQNYTLGVGKRKTV